MFKFSLSYHPIAAGKYLFLVDNPSLKNNICGCFILSGNGKFIISLFLFETALVYQNRFARFAFLVES